MKKTLLYLALICIALLLSAGIVQAQEATCPALVEAALAELSDNCSDLERNSACYGHDSIAATFFEPVEEGFFSSPSDRTPLLMVDTIQTQPLDLEDSIWGISVLNVQANVPNTLPGQNVTFLLVGDAEIENDVPANEAVPSVSPVEIRLRADASVFASAQENTTLTILEAGTELLADAVNSTTRRVRILHNDTPAWIDRSAVNSPNILSSLPEITADSRTPMQAFYFTTGVEAPACNDAPSFLSIQGAENLSVNLNINGIDVSIGSLVVLHTIEEGRIGLSVIEGVLETVDGQVVQGGETLVALIDEEQRIFAWETIRELSQEEQAAGTLSMQMLEELDLLQTPEPSEPTATPTTEPETPPTATPVPPTQTGECPGLSGEQTYIVQRGDTLFEIARRFDASMPAILTRNGLTDPNVVFVGQQLFIPAACSGFVGVPGGTTEGDTGGTCAGFVPTSPIEGISHDENISFYWDPAVDVSGYKLNIYNAGGALLRSVTTIASITTATGFVGLSEVRPTHQFQWDVQAFGQDGNVICTTRRVILARDEFPRPPVGVVVPVAPAPLPSVSMSCGSVFEYQFSWSGLGAGDTITFTFIDNITPASIGPFNTASGSSIYNAGSTSTVTSPMATLGSGATIPVTPSSLSC